MTKGAKIAIIVTLSVLAVSATCIGGAVWWWSANEEKIVEGLRGGLEEGAAFGQAAADQQACIDEGLARSSECGQLGIACGTKAQIFTQGCLYAAPRVPGLCDGVPGPTDIIDTVSWSTDQCAAADQTVNNFCGNIYGALQGFCAEPDLPMQFQAP